MSALVNLCFFCQTFFFLNSSICLLTNKIMVITEPTVATAQLLHIGLGSSLLPFFQTQVYEVDDQKRPLKCRSKAFFMMPWKRMGEIE